VINSYGIFTEKTVYYFQYQSIRTALPMAVSTLLHHKILMNKKINKMQKSLTIIAWD